MKYCITDENEILINRLLDDNNVDNIIHEILIRYNKKTGNTMYLLKLIESIVNDSLENTKKQLREHLTASAFLISQRIMNKDGSYFASMVPVCQALFPEGVDEKDSIAAKQYFNEFLDLCRDKKMFSWENEGDVKWAEDYGYKDYLHMIFDKYI